MSKIKMESAYPSNPYVDAPIKLRKSLKTQILLFTSHVIAL